MLTCLNSFSLSCICMVSGRRIIIWRMVTFDLGNNILRKKMYRVTYGTTKNDVFSTTTNWVENSLKVFQSTTWNSVWWKVQYSRLFGQSFISCRKVLFIQALLNVGKDMLRMGQLCMGHFVPCWYNVEISIFKGLWAKFLWFIELIEKITPTTTYPGIL